MNRERRKKIEQTLKKIAKEEGVPESEIRNEIASAMLYAQKYSDIEIQRSWKDIPCENATPTIEEFIDFVAGKVSESK